MSYLVSLVVEVNETKGDSLLEGSQMDGMGLKTSRNTCGGRQTVVKGNEGLAKIR